MAMQVNQAWRDELAARIDRLRSSLGRDRLLDCLNDAPADADVAFASERLTGIEHVAALDHEVELIIGTDCRIGALRERSRRDASGERKDIAARQRDHSVPPPVVLCADNAPLESIKQAGDDFWKATMQCASSRRETKNAKPD